MFALLASFIVATHAAGLVDHPIAGDSVMYLDGANWTVASSDYGASARASVPGDLISDLFNAGLIEYPFFELNFKNGSIWDDYVWTYAVNFTATPAMLAAASSKSIGTFVLCLHFART